MFKKSMVLELAACICLLAATNLSYAGCAACGGDCSDGGCAATGCAAGNCGGGCGLLGGLCKNNGHCGGANSGVCLTCENIWDGYCASKKHCLPTVKIPGGGLFGHGAGCGCNSCCSVGVGLYGARGCPPKRHHLANLFKRKHKPRVIGCADGCDGNCDGGCDAGLVTSSFPVGNSAPAATTNSFNYSSPAYQSAPMPTAPAMDDDSGGSIEPSPPESIDVSPAQPVPPDAPEVVPATPPVPEAELSPSNQTGTFNWLHRALTGH